ncbi:class GN sortase [Dokdonella sp.]|uniref:class GN sortase n=1 Tax=Dokdonella sp. TaxID=2291710 RepID=UPI001B1D8C32|nr:class GN sortase [Dokdonella sp.]MBO9664401.1 class GN sortase [Dokdonella sp.]
MTANRRAPLVGPRGARRLACALAVLAALPLGHAGYLHAKAQLAQVLLERAWHRAQQQGTAPRPWPWADTAPVARLRAARLGIDRIVLDGDSGRTLAFGPGWAPASARPGTHGVVMISAHRDTHFGFLRDLRQGDRLALDGVRGSRRYRVSDLRVVDSRDGLAALPAGGDGLVLVTCYPFDAIVPGGPLRYVVSAVADDDVSELSSAVVESAPSSRMAAIAAR